MAKKYSYDVKNKKIIEEEIEDIQLLISAKTEIKLLKKDISDTNEKLIECFEHFLNKITNVTNISDLLKFGDYPHDLSNLLKERLEIRKKIAELESEVESDG